MTKEMERAETRTIEPDGGLLGQMISGAIRGAIWGPVVFLGFFIFEVAISFFAESSFWTPATLKFTFSVAISCIFGGAFSGALWPFTHDRAGRITLVLALGGGMTGAAYWVLHRPNMSILVCSVIGFVIVGGFVLLMSLGDHGSGNHNHTNHQEWKTSFGDSSGPPIQCPNCSQDTNNHSFCEVCGRDIRKNPPPLVLPDGTVVEGQNNA